MSQLKLSQKKIDVLKGVGPKLLEKFASLGLYTLQDLLFHLPFRYQDRSHLVPIAMLRVGEESLTQGEIISTRVVFGKKRSMLCDVSDSSGVVLTLRFFHFNQQQKNNLAPGRYIRCFSEVKNGKQGPQMIHPDYRFISDQMQAVEDSYTPIYHLTDGLSQQTIKHSIEQALTLLSESSLEDYLPTELMQTFDYPDIATALRFIHQPPPDSSWELLATGNNIYRQRLAFEELLAHQLSVRQQACELESQQAPVFNVDSDLQKSFLKQLPFELTMAQQRVVSEISKDINRAVPMHRLLQGDVGAGKTVVAALAILQAVGAGYQAAIMAPTELLAEQHLKIFLHWLQPLQITCVWLSAKVKAKARKQALQEIGDGQGQVIIGTHALFQEQVDFHNLGLVIIDEQHRFGVHQRQALRQKGSTGNTLPHQLIMTATPIPRTLAMTAYADLSCSIIDQLPPGRKPVDTVLISQNRRDEVIERIYQACLSGRQSYWVCTLIEESETLQCQAAEQTYEQLQQQLPQLGIGMVHGRMKGDEKVAVMEQFKNNEIQLLIATTVIEVGVDVPNASLMIIENAERLGLSQLHQLRGRVGRGEQKSACVLMYGMPLSRQGKERLQTLRSTEDGFKIAEKDLQLRGPGELLGTRQTGLAQMRIANLITDQVLIPAASNMAIQLLQNYPEVVPFIIRRWVGDGLDYRHV